MAALPPSQDSVEFIPLGPRDRVSKPGPFRVPALTAAALLVAGLFMLPIGSILVSVFLPSQGTWQHLAETVLPGYILNTTFLVIGVGVGVLVVGVSTAWLVTMCRFPGVRLFEWALILPLAVPAYVMAYSYTDFLQFAGPLQSTLREIMGWEAGDYWFPNVRSLEGAMLMLVMVLYPYVYLLTRAAFIEQSVCILEVSRTLGCNAWRSFWQVALPTARPAIAAGTALALMETLADYGTVSFFGLPTFTTGIIRAWIAFGDPIAAAQLAVALLSFVLLVLVLERWSRGRARFHQTSSRFQQLPSYRLTGWRALGAILVCVLPLTLGFLLPAAILIEMTIEVGDTQFGPRYFGLIRNSLILAGVTAMLAVAIATLLAYGRRLSPGPVIGMANRVAAMGYAIPGTVIAVGVLIPAALFDNTLDAWMRASFGISTGLLLTGTIAALVFAYLVRFLAVSLGTVDASLAKVRPSMDDAARSLGARPGGVLVRVHAPLMRGSMLTAGLIVLVDVMKELPATLVMRPFNFDTLAVQAYNLASDERLAESSTASITIVAVGVLPLILLSAAIRRSRPGHAEKQPQ